MQINKKIEEYNFLEIIQLFNCHTLNEKQIEEMFNEYNNRLNYYILKLFDYNISENIIQGEERIFSIYTESLNELIEKEV